MTNEALTLMIMYLIVCYLLYFTFHYFFCVIDSLGSTPIQYVRQRPNNDLPNSLPRAVKPNKTIDSQNPEQKLDTSTLEKEIFDTRTPKDEVYSNL